MGARAGKPFESEQQERFCFFARRSSVLYQREGRFSGTRCIHTP